MNLVILIRYSWLAFWLLWILWGLKARSQKKATNKNDTQLYRLFHILMMSVFICLPLFDFDNFLSDNIFEVGIFIEVFGAVIFFFSICLMLWARKLLGDNWSGQIQKVNEQNLITSGPYAVIRNPIYTGVICGYLGTFISFHTWASMISFTGITIMLLIKTNREEKFLLQVFGEEYQTYIKKTNALIPFIY